MRPSGNRCDGSFSIEPVRGNGAHALEVALAASDAGERRLGGCS
jgi:hypothetical protein